MIKIEYVPSYAHLYGILVNGKNTMFFHREHYTHTIGCMVYIALACSGHAEAYRVTMSVINATYETSF